MTSGAPTVQVGAETDIVLRDGSTVHVRPSTIEDVPRLRAFLESLSVESRWFRFFSAGVNLDAAARSAAASDGGLALIALREATVVAHGTYVCGAAGRAEVAFAVADAWHGHGLATVLLAHLAHAASHAGIDTFTAASWRATTGCSECSTNLGSWSPRAGLRERSRSSSRRRCRGTRGGAIEERQREADVAAVGHVLRPSSVAVVGATRTARDRRRGGRAQPARRWVLGAAAPRQRQRRSGGGAADGPDDRRCRGRGRARRDRRARERGPRRRASLRRQGRARPCGPDAGFAVVGPAGRARQDELLAACRAAGVRMVGPNCLGVASPRPEIALNATVAPAAPSPGDVGFASQSGGFGIAAIDEAAARGIGFSSFVSMGDKVDLSSNDFLEYWEQDPDTAVVLLYLESFGNPRRFARVARRITAAKPIVAVKSARTAGRPAAWSRTGALLSAADVTVDALVRARRRAAGGDGRGDVRRRRAARAPAAPARRPRRGANQRRRSRDRSVQTPARRRGCASSRSRRPRGNSSARGCGPRCRPRTR